LLRTVFEHPDADAVRQQMSHVIGSLHGKFPSAGEHLGYDQPGFDPVTPGQD
jgi:hypothetical protein